MEASEISQTSTTQNKKGYGLLAFGLALVFATAAFFSGMQLGSNVAAAGDQEANIFSFLQSKTAPAEDVDLDEFWRVWNLLEEKYSFKKEYAKKCLLNNKHNHVTTTYYLLFQKYERLGMLK